jgi:hypothetical protein
VFHSVNADKLRFSPSLPRPQQYRTRTLTTSGSPDGEATPHHREEEATDSVSTGLGLPRPSKEHVQRVYSEDKVLPLVIGGIALLKAHSAEDKLQQTLSNLRQSVFRERELGKGISAVGPITPEHSKHLDKKKQIPNKAKEEANIQSQKRKKPSTAELTVEAGGGGVVVKQIYIARDDHHSKSSHSVSTLTGGLRNSVDEEDDESLTFRIDSIKLTRSTPFTRTIEKDCQSVISTDDFGSIAASMPDAAAKFQTRIVI